MPKIAAVVCPTEYKTCFKVGRGFECEWRINEDSISRLQAKIYYRDGEFYIQDYDSKFGSLLQAEEVVVTPGCKQVVQIGKTLISFSPKPLTKVRMVKKLLIQSKKLEAMSKENFEEKIIKSITNNITL